MERQAIKKILREVIKEEEAQDMESYLQENYPALWELKEKGSKGYIGYLKQQAQSLGLKMGNKMINNDNEHLKEAVKKIIPKVIKSKQLEEEQREKLEEAERIAKWYRGKKSHREAKEENKEKMKEEFGIIGDFFENKSEWYDKYPNLSNEKLSSTKGESTPFIVKQFLQMYQQGVEQGYRNLSPGQKEKLEDSDDILRDIINDEQPDEYEYLGRGSYRNIGNEKPMSMSVVWQMIRNNTEEAMTKAISKIIKQYKENNKNVEGKVTMPEHQKKDFDKFYEHIKALAYEMGLDIFSDLQGHMNQELVRDSFYYWWQVQRER